MNIDIMKTVQKFFENQFLVEFDGSVTDATNIFKNGLVDSFGFLELVTFLEQTFQIKISDEELVSDDLISLKNITACIDRKLNAN